MQTLYVEVGPTIFTFPERCLSYRTHFSFQIMVSCMVNVYKLPNRLYCGYSVFLYRSVRSREDALTPFVIWKRDQVTLIFINSNTIQSAAMSCVDR